MFSHSPQRYRYHYSYCIMCLITTCVSKFTIYDNLNKSFLSEARLHYCLNTKICKMLLLQFNKFSTTAYIFPSMSVNFLVFFDLFIPPFKRTILALVLSHWTCGRVLICHLHYEQQHVLPPQDYCSYC